MRTNGTVILHSGKGVVFETETAPEQLEADLAAEGFFMRIDGVNDVGADVVILVARSDVAALVLQPPRQLV